jgi:hypothetical protein
LTAARATSVITVECSMCHGRVDVALSADRNRQMDLIFRAGFHVVTLEPPLPSPDNSHPLVCFGCAFRINGQKPS